MQVAGALAAEEFQRQPLQVGVGVVAQVGADPLADPGHHDPLAPGQQPGERPRRCRCPRGTRPPATSNADRRPGERFELLQLGGRIELGIANRLDLVLVRHQHVVDQRADQIRRHQAGRRRASVSTKPSTISPARWRAKTNSRNSAPVGGRRRAMTSSTSPSAPPLRLVLEAGPRARPRFAAPAGGPPRRGPPCSAIAASGPSRPTSSSVPRPQRSVARIDAISFQRPGLRRRRRGRRRRRSPADRRRSAAGRSAPRRCRHSAAPRSRSGSNQASTRSRGSSAAVICRRHLAGSGRISSFAVSNGARRLIGGGASAATLAAIGLEVVYPHYFRTSILQATAKPRGAIGPLGCLPTPTSRWQPHRERMPRPRLTGGDCSQRGAASDVTVITNDSTHRRTIMEFRKIVALRGPNIWHRLPVLEAWIELGDLKDSAIRRRCPASTTG